MLSFVVAGIGCALAALCYAEFASMVPVAGSAYTYAYATLGELFAWIIGWDLDPRVRGGVEHRRATAGRTTSLPCSALFGVTLPKTWTANPFDYDPALGRWLATGVDLQPAGRARRARSSPSMLVIGIRESAGFNAAMVILKLVVVLFVIAVGSAYVDPTNWHPFLPYGWGGVMQGAGYIFFAYIGFDSVSTHAEEAREPAARRADRHHRLATLLHGPLRARWPRC